MVHRGTASEYQFILGKKLEEMVSKVTKDNDLQEENEKLEQEDVESSEEAVKVSTEEEAPDLEQELVAAREEIDTLRDKMLRMAAESENFKKRMERERAAALKYSGEQIFREILPAVDNLERAVAHCNDMEDAEANFKAFLEGVQLTLKSLLTTLEKFEVKAIESMGEPFDPNHQEALTMEASDSVPANHVVNEFEKGYYYKDRLLRAAKVVVSSGKANG